MFKMWSLDMKCWEGMEAEGKVRWTWIWIKKGREDQRVGNWGGAGHKYNVLHGQCYCTGRHQLPHLLLQMSHQSHIYLNCRQKMQTFPKDKSFCSSAHAREQFG